MPEDTKLPLIGFDMPEFFNRVVHAEILVVLGENP